MLAQKADAERERERESNVDWLRDYLTNIPKGKVIKKALGDKIRAKLEEDGVINIKISSANPPSLTYWVNMTIDTNNQIKYSSGYVEKEVRIEDDLGDQERQDGIKSSLKDAVSMLSY